MEERKSDIPKIGIKINSFIDTLKRNPSKIYFSIFFIYFVGLVSFLFINLTSETKINIEENAINETIKLNDNPITLVSRTLNKETDLVKLAFYYDSKSRSELQNMNLEFETLPFSDMDYSIETEVIRATENYYVVFLKNVPEDFGALSTTIIEDRSKLNDSISSESTESIDSSSIETSNDGLSIKVRGLQESFTVDNDLEIKDKTFYAKESVDYEISTNEQLITNYEEDILSLTDENINIDTEIEKINGEIPYELEEKVPDLEKEIITFEERKIENKTEISKINDQIKEVKEKIKLLETKKNDIK